MTAAKDYNHTISLGESALAQIKKNRMPALPKFYEFWYTYAAGFNKKFNSALADLIDTKGRISQDDLESLYDQHLNASQTNGRVMEVGGRITAEINALTDKFDKSGSLISDYGETLKGANSNLEHLSDPTELRKLVKHLRNSTHDTMQVNSSLQQHLAESRKTIESLKADLDSIRQESITDQLTTLFNRRHFDQSLDRLVAESQRNRNPLSLLMIDVDRFKKFNDTFGHQTGDQVLRLVALAIRQNVKGHDVPCRYGGEEFSVILPATSIEKALTVAEHIRKAVMSKELVKRSSGEELGRITASIGVSTLRSRDGANELVARADAALYTAKQTGRNRTCRESSEKRAVA